MSSQFSAGPIPVPLDLLFPDDPIDVMFVWRQRDSGIQINGRRLCTALLRKGVPDWPGPQARAFVWTVNPILAVLSWKYRHIQVLCVGRAYCSAGVPRRPFSSSPAFCASVRPVSHGFAPSMSDGHTHTHTHAPWQQCLSCPVRFEDYIGASNGGSSEIVVADDQKYALCVFELLRRHAELLACQPALKHIVPFPQERMSMSKRRWETCMYHARTIFRMFFSRTSTITCSCSCMPELVKFRAFTIFFFRMSGARKSPMPLWIAKQVARRSWEEVEGGAEAPTGSRAISQTSLGERI